MMENHNRSKLRLAGALLAMLAAFRAVLRL
jgi:hypothetical protein